MFLLGVGRMLSMCVRLAVLVLVLLHGLLRHHHIHLMLECLFAVLDIVYGTERVEFDTNTQRN